MESKDMVFNPAFQGATFSTNRYRILYGGAGSGKSHHMAQEVLFSMLKRKDYKYLLVRKTGKSIRNSVFQLLVDMIQDNDLHQYFKVNKTDMTVKCITGSSIITSGLDKPNAVQYNLL